MGMKMKSKKARNRPECKPGADCAAPDSPQSAFVALFSPIRDESWPNVQCSYLFTGGEEKAADRNRF
jgi:hypothetical protein